MYVRAKNEFNHGGIVAMKCGEYRDLPDNIAEKLLELDLVEKNTPSHKKMEVKNVTKSETDSESK